MLFRSVQAEQAVATVRAEIDRLAMNPITDDEPRDPRILMTVSYPD